MAKSYNNTLYQKYRPEVLEDLRGNDALVDGIISCLDRDFDEIPKVWLLTGEPGTGKTTTARILKEELECTTGFFEMNAGDERKVADIRRVIQELKYPTLDNSAKIYFFDECFAEGTQIRLADGTTKNIERIVKGDKVQNLKGTGEVTCIFKNRVPLNRVVKVKAGQHEVICSCDHEFLTNSGWKKAKELTSQDKVILPKRIENEKTVCTLQKRFEKRPDEILQQGMCLRTQENAVSGGEGVLCMQQNFFSEILSSKENMFTKMWKRTSGSEKNRKENKQRNLFENLKGTQKFQRKQQTTFRKSVQRKFKENEKEQSYAQKRNYSKNERYERTKRNSACVAWYKRRQWKVNKTSKSFSRENRTIDRIRNSYRTFYKRWFWLPLELQSRFSRTFSKVSCRNRWQGTSFEREATLRQEKRKEISFTRVDSVEVYKRGSNDKSFESVIRSKERNQGFVYFYDFEVSGHHSYVANDMLVHNCHQLTKDAWEALNKPTEFVEENTFFIFATSEPTKIPGAIKSRATHFHFKPLNGRDMFKLLKDVCKKEKLKISEAHLDIIAENSNGSCRTALNALDKISKMTDKKKITEVLENISGDSPEIIEICKILLKKTGEHAWKELIPVLKNFQGEPESARRHILMYFNAVLLNGTNEAALHMESFEENYYDTGKAGLTLSCFRACFAREGQDIPF